MENESTFVAPEGVYSVTEEHRPPLLQGSYSTHLPILYPTRLSSIAVRFPAAKHPSSPGFAQLLGGNKESKKENRSKEREDGASLSSSDTPDEVYPIEQTSSTTQESTPATPMVFSESHNIFSHPGAAGKKRSRPKHSIRTTSSTFVTRMQCAEGLTKLLQSKQGEITFWFYNVAKNFVWVEIGSKLRVRVKATSCTNDVISATFNHRSRWQRFRFLRIPLAMM